MKVFEDRISRAGTVELVVSVDSAFPEYIKIEEIQLIGGGNPITIPYSTAFSLINALKRAAHKSEAAHTSLNKIANEPYVEAPPDSR